MIGGIRSRSLQNEKVQYLADRFGLAFHALPSGNPRPFKKNLPWYFSRALRLGRHLVHRHNQRESAVRWLNGAPALVSKLDVDALIVEQYVAAGGSIADYLGIPFATVSTSLDWRTIPDHPPIFFNWAYADTRAARLRNRVGYAVWHEFMAPTLDAITDWRIRHGLSSLRYVQDLLSAKLISCRVALNLTFRKRLCPGGIMGAVFHVILLTARRVTFPGTGWIGVPSFSLRLEL